MRTRAAVTHAASTHIPTSDYIPLGTPVTPHVIKLLGTGDYLAIWRLEGITFETADRAEILVRKEALHHFIRALGGGAYALWSHKIRRVVRERLSGKSPNAFCQELHERYEQSFDQHRQMATELYISVVYRPSPSKVRNFFTRMGKRTLQQLREQETEHLTKLEETAHQLEASLRRYGPLTFTRRRV